MEYRNSGEKFVVIKNKEIMLYFIGKVMLNINDELGFLFIDELGRKLKGWDLSVSIFRIKLKGRWCDIVNVHAPSEDKDDAIKDSFYEEIE